MLVISHNLMYPPFSTQIHRSEVLPRSGKVFCTFVLFSVLIVVNVVALMILVTVLMVLLLPHHLHNILKGRNWADLSNLSFFLLLTTCKIKLALNKKVWL